MYREYKIQSGSYVGTHKIYLHPDYWRKDYPDSVLKVWTKDLVYEVGDWVQSMDGFVCQVLKVSPMKNVITVMFIRFPMGTMTLYQKKDKTYKFSNFYAIMTPYEKNSVNKNGRVDKTSTQRIKFAYLVSQGVELTSAYQQAFPFKYKQYFTIKREIKHLLQDELVRNTLMTELKPFTDKLNERITEDQIIVHLEELLEKSRKGSQNHRENIKFIMELKGMIKPESNKRMIENADYTEILPQQLPQ